MIPLVFSFDNNLLIPAGVCLQSLLINSKDNEFYDIYILHNNSLNKNKAINLFEKLNKFKKFQLTFKNVGDYFDGAFEIRGITIAAYFRLLIPEVIKKYDKVIYSDVDVIFKEGLGRLYESFDFEDQYVAGVKAVLLEKQDIDYVKSVNCSPFEYINSGFLIFNIKEIKLNKVVDLFKSHLKNKYLYQDQDIINITCKGKIKYLSPRYTFAQGAYRYSYENPDKLDKIFTKNEIKEAIEYGIIHYNGVKPWNNFCFRYDIWWNYYRNSVFFEEKKIFETEKTIVSKLNTNFIMKLKIGLYNVLKWRLK